jgi:Fur family ferric uptake transcriptional regulator
MEATDILRLHNIKKTPGRLAIIRALQESILPLSENDIKVKMNDFYDRVTFYRNIQTLSTLGVIHKIVIDNTLVKYGLNFCDNGHHHQNEHAHFYCEDCQEVICLKQVSIPQINLPGSYKVTDKDFILKGKCEHCNH